MWKRFTKILCCPICRSSLELLPFSEMTATLSDQQQALSERLKLYDDEFKCYVDAGLLACHSCRKWYPVMRGLPILLLYRTSLHRQFATDYREQMSKLKQPYSFPQEEPEPGERFVMESFSEEWRDYDYDGVLWKTSYEDQELTFLNELGRAQGQPKPSRFLEVGCGLGMMTSFVHKHCQVDAVGADLSIAAMRASYYHRSNPFLHFVQASGFRLPFLENSFDIVYSRGVLHHTYSTRRAFMAIAPYCKPDGLTYIWVYGKQSIQQNLFRKAAYLVEALTRPVLSKRPSSALARLFLGSAALSYMAVNKLHRMRNPQVQRYSYSRAIHAARDRFTPQYAHRHGQQEVVEWFEESGFREIEVVDWQLMPPAERENFKRNVGVRGRRSHRTSCVQRTGKNAGAGES